MEQLVAHLEKCLSQIKIKITSPDWIEDKTTGEKREVDVSLRGKVGSHDVLIILECRDRKGTEDVTWIEQLATKRDDIGADKAIAVFNKALKINPDDGRARYYKGIAYAHMGNNQMAAMLLSEDLR